MSSRSLSRSPGRSSSRAGKTAGRTTPRPVWFTPGATAKPVAPTQTTGI